MTKTEKLVCALIQMGAKEIPSTSRKYRTFTRLDEQAGFYFVGKAGALRTGRCVSNSVSLERFVLELLAKSSNEHIKAGSNLHQKALKEEGKA